MIMLIMLYDLLLYELICHYDGYSCNRIKA